MKPEPTYTPIQRVFLASKVNGGIYIGNLLPPCAHNGIILPRETWLSRRLAELRRKGAGDEQG